MSVSTKDRPDVNPPADGGSRRPAWRDDVDPHAKAHVGRAILAIATSVLPFIGLWALMYLSLDVSYWITLALAIPTAGFLVRTYILFHDCTHGSLLPSKRANSIVGGMLGLLVFTPFAWWKADHAAHHATAGDLDRRGQGDVPTLTLAEYQAMPWYGRLGYRLFRNPVVMFGLGPLYAMLIMPRIPQKGASARMKRSVWATNLGLVLIVGSLCVLLGWREFLLVQAPLVPLAGGAGIWLFYVQHQFDDVYWKRTPEWDYTDAALKGSSYLRLPKVLQFFSGNIGLHHVHHLSSKIPNYYLQRAHDQGKTFQDVRKFSLWDGLRAVRYKLWDEGSGRLVTWPQVRELRNSAVPVPVPVERRPGR